MADLVDLAIPANAQEAAEVLGLKVHRSVTSGARVRQIPREEAEIAVECLRDWGISARILEDAPRSERPAERSGLPAA
jgi:hydrogenase maturation factor